MRKLKNILLVDDDEVTNFINAEIIKGLDITEHIDICLNGRDALFFMDEAHKGTPGYLLPELLFLDINMPVMDGFKFLEVYSGRSYSAADTFVITMLTTSLRLEDMELAQQYENIVSGYIEKPLTKTVVLSVLERYFCEVRHEEKN